MLAPLDILVQLDTSYSNGVLSNGVNSWQKKDFQMKNISLNIILIFVLIFLLIVFSNVLKSIYFNQQKLLSEYQCSVKNYEDIFADLENEISELSKDSRIIDLARNELRMDFPKSKDIIYVIKNRVERDNYKYTLRKFFSPEVIADDN
ncbi:MAG: hypothetical protein H8D22_05795 [Candidatus Cloacimonetes bacterium]|nr:hypothetical protein [Candidatus Cloacimonadota bacterium]